MHLSLAPLRRVLLSRPFNTAAARAVHVSAQQNKKQTAPLPSAAESLALESLAKKDSTQKKDKSAVEEPRNTDRTMQPLSQVFPILFLMFVFQLSCLCLLSAYFCLFLISSGHPIKANVRIQGSAATVQRGAHGQMICAQMACFNMITYTMTPSHHSGFSRRKVLHLWKEAACCLTKLRSLLSRAHVQRPASIKVYRSRAIQVRTQE